MKTGLFLILFALTLNFLLTVPVYASEDSMTLEEFTRLWETEGKTPEGAVRCLIIGVIETVKNNNPDGPKMWGMALPKQYTDAEGNPDNSQRSARNNFSRVVAGTNFKGAIATSYLGGTPENGYQYSYDNKVTLDKRQGKVEESTAKIFVKSGGKDMSSPVQLRKNKDGYWKIFEYSSLYTGVKPIKSDDF